jgi:hypothetical protein
LAANLEARIFWGATLKEVAIASLIGCFGIIYNASSLVEA